MRRLAIVLALVVVLPALALVIVLGFRQRVGDLEERLVRDANATFTAPRPRPTHATARPGTFGEAVLAHLPAIQVEADARKEDEEGRNIVRAIVAGERPVTELPAAWREGHERLRPALDGLLAGTHAERADLHPPDDDPFRPAPGTSWQAYELAALLAGVEVREALAAGDPSRAAARCLDGLGLARDAAVGCPTMLGRAVSSGMVERLTPPCADALAALPAGGRADAANALRVIAGAFPSLDETMRHEALSMELVAFGHVMDPDARAQLVLAVQGYLPRDEPRGVIQRLVARDAWRSMRRLLDAQVSAFGLPAGPREVALRRTIEEARQELNPFPYIALPDFSKHARRADAAELRLDALLLVAAALDHREATGAWPARVEDLAGPLGGAAPRLASATVLTARGEAFEVTVTLPRWKDEAVGELVLRVAPPSPLPHAPLAPSVGPAQPARSRGAPR